MADQIPQNPRSNVLMVPYLVVLWGTFGGTTTIFPQLLTHIANDFPLGCMYMMGRKVLGYNSAFGKE
jgi:hypothetical protein